ncbi:MAG: amidohydrolase family protein [Dehalococcoidia bacterium]
MTVIDVHDHFTTTPAALNLYRAAQISSANKPRPFRSSSVSDAQLTDAVQGSQLNHMEFKGIDRLIFSPQAGAMGHQFGDEIISRYWTQACNDLIYRVCRLFPDKLIPSCQLPQSPGLPPVRWLDELEFRVKEQGFVACNINPDISGGAPPFTPSVASEWWYPLYDKLQELDVPGHFHVSATLNPAFHMNGSHYLAWHHTTAFEIMWAAERIFTDFPRLKLVIAHGGGAVVLQHNRTRALFETSGKDFDAAVRTLYWDMAVYEQETMQTMVNVIGTDKLLYASEMWGTANAIDPRTGRYFDDTLPFVKTLGLSGEDECKLLEGNARRLYTHATFDP